LLPSGDRVECEPTIGLTFRERSGIERDTWAVFDRCADGSEIAFRRNSRSITEGIIVIDNVGGRFVLLVEGKAEATDSR
jgi:hypothetical protein